MGSMTSRARVRLSTLALVFVAAGCSGGEWIYEKPGVSPARFDQDLAQCQREADRPSTLGLTRADRADQEVLRRCMERRGYQVRRSG